MLGRDLIERADVGPTVQVLTKVRKPDLREHDVPPAGREQEGAVEGGFGSGQQRLLELVWIEVGVLCLRESHVPTVRSARAIAGAFRGSSGVEPRSIRPTAMDYSTTDLIPNNRSQSSRRTS